MPQDSAGQAAWRGLTEEDARERLARLGPNRLVPDPPRTSPLGWLRRAITDPMSLLLLAAASIYLVLGDIGDAVAMLVALLPITAVTIALESRAERALTELHRLAAPVARVVRDGVGRRVPAADLVVDDLIEVREGDLVPADALLTRSTELHVDESSLTGESLPIEKAGTGVEIFAGTTVLSGRAVATVVGTGSATRYGRIGALLSGTQTRKTPLERAIRGLVLRLTIVALLFCAGVIALGLLRGDDFGRTTIAAVSLAMAAIPEELPMVFALYLGLGAWRLARDRALVRRLSDIETLGTTTVICTDKTGTVTEGRLELARVVPIDGSSEEVVLRAAILASERDPYDPIDAALVRAARARGIDVGGLHAQTLIRDHPFDPRRRYVTHVWREPEMLGVYAKGSVEGILDACDPAMREAWPTVVEAHRDLAEEGMRVLAVATGRSAEHAPTRAHDEATLEPIGLIAFADPIRAGIETALDECRRAGVRVLLVTGDHPATAGAIGRKLGFHGRIVTGDELAAASDDDAVRLTKGATIFARIRPEEKHRLVRALRRSGEVVAMTGDGTNDAPALREADIGVAMGERGTEVARAAASLVILDDAFGTIVGAIRDGRRIFENLRRAFSYLISFHLPLLVSAVVVPLTGAPLLLLPIHLVWLELIVHPTSTLVFEGDPADPDLMHRPPRLAKAGFIDRSSLGRTLATGTTLTGAVLSVYLGALGSGMATDAARGAGLLALLLGQIALVLVERVPERPVWTTGPGGNVMLLPVLGATALSIGAVFAIAPLSTLLHVAAPPAGWAIAAAIAGPAATLWREPFKRAPAIRHSQMGRPDVAAG